MSKKEAGSRKSQQAKKKLGGSSKPDGKQPKQKQQNKKKKNPQPRKQPQSRLSNDSSADQLRLSQAQASSGSFDKWLQVEYLPSDFKPAEEDRQVQAAGLKRKRWYRRLRFDLRALMHSFSVAILIIWLASLTIFTFYLLSPCSPLAVVEVPSSGPSSEPAVVEASSTSTATPTTSEEIGSSTFSTAASSTTSEQTTTAKKKPKSFQVAQTQSAQQLLRHQLSHYKLGDGFARVKDIFFDGDQDEGEDGKVEDNSGNNESESSHHRLLQLHNRRLLLLHSSAAEEYTLEDNLASCLVLTVFAIANIGLATVLLLHLLLYLLHVVELLGVIFPWFALEIAYSACFVLVTLVLCITLAVMSPISATGAIIVLGNLQLFFGLIFCFNRFRQCRAGQLPQDLDDDVDGDFIRNQPQLKNSVMAVRAPIATAGGGKKHTPKGKQAGKSKQAPKVVYKKMFKIAPTSVTSATPTSSSTSNPGSSLQQQQQQSKQLSSGQSSMMSAKSKLPASSSVRKLSSKSAPTAKRLSSRGLIKSFKSKSVRKSGGGGKSVKSGGKMQNAGKLSSTVERNSLSISSSNYSRSKLNSSSQAGSSSLSDAK